MFIMEEPSSKAPFPDLNIKENIVESLALSHSK